MSSTTTADGNTIRKTIHQVQFGWYTDADHRARSVVEIVSPETFGHDRVSPLPGGVYDAKLGPGEDHVKANSLPVCPTCAQWNAHCGGHFGHIELCVPVYQPLLFPVLLKILQVKCFQCHHLRAPKRQLQILTAKFQLARANRMAECLQLEDTLAQAMQHDRGEAFAGSMSAAAAKGELQMSANRALDRVLDPLLRGMQNSPIPKRLTTYQRQLLRDLQKQAASDLKGVKACAHCGVLASKIRHDQANKVFVSLPKTGRGKHAVGPTRKSALETLAEQAHKQDDHDNGDPQGYDTDDTADTEDRQHKYNNSDNNNMVSDEDSDDDEDNNHNNGNNEDDDDRIIHNTNDDHNIDNDQIKMKQPTDQYIHPGEVQAQLRLTWRKHAYLLSEIFLHGSTMEVVETANQKQPQETQDTANSRKSSPYDRSYEYMFCQVVAVPPSRFRPPMKLGAMTVEHGQNTHLNNVLKHNIQVRKYLFANKNDNNNNKHTNNDRSYNKSLTPEQQEAMAHEQWIQLQTAYNSYMDSTKNPNQVAVAMGTAPLGIKQLIEKKEGLFRQHMMGKRVDHACRSVISPDPYVGTNEIGIPLAFASTLTYPTPVTEWNCQELRRLVERGPHEYPGARWVSLVATPHEQRRRIDLTKMSDKQRKALAALLLNHSRPPSSATGGDNGGVGPAIVGRHLRDGDVMLVNRQPTLHKPGIMAHKVRVLHNPTQKTIRMHYANCNTYNADFDGDEMNCHFPQNDLGRAEALYIAQTDLQYIVPTDGTPLRGLIQDHVCGGVMLTKRDTFLPAWEYQQLLFATLASLPGLEIVESGQDIQMLPPAILKPQPLWTGKQVVTTLLMHLCNSPVGQKQKLGEVRDKNTKQSLLRGGISLERKAKTPDSAFGHDDEEHLVLIRDGELLRGILDKSAFGATDFSLVHGVYEAYGPTKAGLLLNSLGRLFTAYIQYYAGHSCRMEDLVLTQETEVERRRLVQKAYNVGSRACKAWADSEGGKVQIEDVSKGSTLPLKPHEVAAASAKVGQLLGGPQGSDNFAALDGYMMSQLNPLASDIVKACLPKGLEIPFPANTFSLMTMTGAKGSIVNQSQVSCALGQQALEGRRVPRLNSGRTLPSFAPYDLHPRADGFVMDRFLTGVRPQEYYFHCMAGREGLVDTAVKTSRSGYLQRCLIKHLEELKVCYDFTVRNGEGGVVQFVYGEDGLDPTKASYLDCSMNSFEYMARNQAALETQYTPLPGVSIDIAARDSERHEAVKREGELRSLLQKGSFVKARRLQVGSMWMRSNICKGWQNAVILKVHKSGNFVDLEYTNDKVRATRVPIAADLGRCGSEMTPAASNQCVVVKPATADPILSLSAGAISIKSTDGMIHRIGSCGACVSERVASAASKALKEPRLEKAAKSCGLSTNEVGKLVAAKYGNALCAAGEAVGCIAAQSVGEPSTQMTLNTFHLAGAGANVTLGIPRLREIIMTAAKVLKTPTMSVPLSDTISEKNALKLTRTFTKLSLMELLCGDRGIRVDEKLMLGSSGDWMRTYVVTLKLHPAERIFAAFGLKLTNVARTVANSFMPDLSRRMKLELRRSAIDGDIASHNVTGGKSTHVVDNGRGGDGDNDGNDDGLDDEEKRSRARNARDELSEDESDDDGDSFGEEDGVNAMRHSGAKDKEADYEADSNDDEEMANNLPDLFTPDASEAAETEIQTDFQTPVALKHFEDGGVKIDSASNSITLPPLEVDPSARPLLMVGLVETAAEKHLVRAKKNIDQAFVNKEDGRGRCLQTAGINFEEIWLLEDYIVDHTRLMSNDTWAVLQKYGVEAARINIVNQIRNVFGAYGIEVDPRHLTLIADYMTFEGGYKAMNRIGMEEMGSALLQMSFETTLHFLTKAAMAGTVDDLESPSANIVMGRPIRHGTGAFDLLARTMP